MASFDKKKNATKGWKLNVKSKALGIHTSFFTGEMGTRPPNKIKTYVEKTIEMVSNGELSFGEDWTPAEKLNFLRNRIEPFREEEKEKKYYLQPILESWIKDVTDSANARRTIIDYQSKTRFALKFFGDTEIKDISRKLIKEHVIDNAFKEGRHKEYVSISTQEKYIAHLRMALKWAITEEELPSHDFNLCLLDGLNYVDRNKPSKIDKLTPYDDFDGRRAQLEGLGIKEDESGAFRKIIYSKEQLVEQREYLKKTLWEDGTFASRRLFAAILFCMATGARRSEIVRMRRCDFNLVSATPTAIKRLRKARGNLYLKEQEVDLHSDLIPYLEMVMRQMPKDQQAVFVSNDIHLNEEEVDEAKEDWKCGQLGSDFKEALAGSKWQYQTGWHTYRHTLASKMIEDGKDRQEIKSFIGWCSDEMYENYTHLLKRKKRQVVTGAYPEEM